METKMYKIVAYNLPTWVMLGRRKSRETSSEIKSLRLEGKIE